MKEIMKNIGEWWGSFNKLGKWKIISLALFIILLIVLFSVL